MVSSKSSSDVLLSVFNFEGRHIEVLRNGCFPLSQAIMYMLYIAARIGVESDGGIVAKKKGFNNPTVLYASWQPIKVPVAAC